PTSYNMASSREEGGPEANSTSESPGRQEPRDSRKLQGAEWIAEIMTTPHQGRFYDNIRMTKPCFYALVDALTSRGLLPHGQTSRDCIGAWMARWYRHGSRVDQNRYRSRKGGLAQNVLAICDFDMNFTYVYAGWEGSAADARVWTMRYHMTTLFPFLRLVSTVIYNLDSTNFYLKGRSHGASGSPYNNAYENADMAYRRYLETAGFPQDLHWTLNVEQRFMWMIVDDNTRAPMRDDAIAEAQMGHWARGLRRHFGYPYTRDQYYPLASRYYQYPEPHYPSMLECGAPLGCRGFLLRTRALQKTTRALTYCVVHEHVARGDGGPQMPHSTSFAARRSPDMGSEVGELDRGQTTSVILGCSLIQVPRLTVMEIAQRVHADHRDSHLGRVTVLGVQCPTEKCE
ncbi:UNVERIFIED_CONTAM: hypothetical protein Scaly_2652600, partial [Sesamum calycinum]